MKKPLKKLRSADATAIPERKRVSGRQAGHAPPERRKNPPATTRRGRGWIS